MRTGEDFQLQFYLGGPPFKYSRALTEHTNFVNCIRYVRNNRRLRGYGAAGARSCVVAWLMTSNRYNPSGSQVISVASDKQGIVYDGKVPQLFLCIQCCLTLLAPRGFPAAAASVCPALLVAHVCVCVCVC